VGQVAPVEAGGEPEGEGEIEIRQLFELEEFGESPAVEWRASSKGTAQEEA
jgi:hypothetical protein